mmetsp:Transcript_14836/g.28571  ORF Transcript_14836/g.28571 Transcript_14836/m.28571 type:complete len:581 (-) Transcript_14836:570-2312(-)|eukprot:CAMPEP_0114262400 /NCGR_PEP_ID=MMETSP0058-20121206/21780_1 /TAXON_ID=36894 /ORGANISM="Pyramimonas parkeae, CCMP726" /LENGTH=580 /DNA_ID=CAMNT_0001378259 /DNA_START=11 /DNA_END=1753 /DNA_ORIENTATION=-
MAQKIMNSPENIVYEMIEGVVATNPGLVRLDGFPNVKAIRRREFDGAKVAVISGGGSGHEPSFAGFVGSGLLTAAVCGGVFASPSADEVLAAIRSVTGPAGCLLVLMNYTGDRLNFGLAAETAKLEGFKVQMLVVGEDCALPPPRGIAGRRGLAGTLLVHKVAGAAAEAGLSLEEVLGEARAAAEAVGTMGVALSACTLPGKTAAQRIATGDMELGLGIHGEPGARKGPLQPADSIVDSILTTIIDPATAYLPVEADEEVTLLINSLGATPPMELAVVANSSLKWLKARNIHVTRVYSGMFMSSLDMVGFSITLMRMTPQRALRLDASHSAPAWPAAPAVHDPSKSPMAMPKSCAEAPASSGSPVTPGGKLLEAAILHAANSLIAAEEKLTLWDTHVGDGDCGITTTRGAKALIADTAAKYPLDDPSGTALQLGLSVRHSMGGTSGALYDIFFHAAAACLKQNSLSEANAALGWASALEAGVQAIQLYGGAKVGDRTMLDALVPATGALKSALSSGTSPLEALEAAVAAAQAGADATCHMDAGAGRSSYVPKEILMDNPDPGAQGAAIWLKAVFESLTKS